MSEVRKRTEQKKKTFNASDYLFDTSSREAAAQRQKHISPPPSEKQEMWNLPPRWSSGTGQNKNGVCLHHLSPGGHHIHTPCADADVALAPLLSSSSLLLPPCSVCLSAGADEDSAAAAAIPPPPQLRTCRGSRVAPQSQDWVGYIPALMPGPYGWHVIGKSHHMRAGDWHAAAFTETGFPPWGRRTRHLSLSWKRKWNKERMAPKKCFC